MKQKKKHIKLILSYDGTHYLGWQKNGLGPSIEGTLQKVLEQILQEKIQLQAASRTDTGVHAEYQVVTFSSSKEDMDLSRLHYSVNCLLPKDIVVLELKEVDAAFHPTLDTKKKEYRYMISVGKVQLPMYRHYSWHIPSALDRKKMLGAIKVLEGQKDFSSLCNRQKGDHKKDKIKHLLEISMEDLVDDRICIRVVGDNFLYKMVRNVVGTLVYVGQNKIQEESLHDIIASKKRAFAGITAPAHGLFLHKVYY